MSLKQDIIDRYGDLFRSDLKVKVSVATQDANLGRPGVQVTSDSAMLQVGGIKKGAVAWIDINGNLKFDAGDIPVTNGLVAVNNLQPGVNVLNVLQSYEGVKSNPTQVAIERDIYLELNQNAPKVNVLTRDANPARDGIQIVSDTIRLNISNVKEDGIAWLDLNRNGSFDVGSDLQVQNGELTIHDIPDGANTFYLYQSVRGVTSNPVSVQVERDLSLEKILKVQYGDQLARLGVAFWGRPLTPKEFDIGMNYMKDTVGDLRPLVEVLLNSNEFLNYINGSPNDTLMKLSLVTNQLFGRDPTASELASAQKDLAGTVMDMIFHPSGADSQVAGARALIAQYITNNSGYFSSLFPNQDIYHQVARNFILQVTKANAQELLIGLNQMAHDSKYRPDAPKVLSKMVDYLLGHITFDAPKQGGAKIWIDLDRSGTIDPTIDLLVPQVSGQYQADVVLEKGLNTFVAYTEYYGYLSDPTMVQLVGVLPPDSDSGGAGGAG